MHVPSTLQDTYKVIRKTVITMPPSVEKDHHHVQQQQQQHDQNDDQHKQQQQQTSCEIKQNNNNEIQKEEELSKQEELDIHKFGEYCRAFYTASLQCRTSSLSSSSLCSSSSESDDNDDVEKVNEKTKENGRTVLNAFDYASNCCNDIPPPPTSQQQPSKLYQTYLSNISSQELHHLQQCGILSCPTFPSILLSKPYIKSRYIQKRDTERRRAHKITMFQRHSTLSNIVMNAEEEEERLTAATATTTRSLSLSKENNNGNDEEEQNGDIPPRLAKKEEITKLHQTIATFSHKYSKNIGTHSFLAGLIQFIKTQMEQTCEKKIVRWTFPRVVLSEASIGGEDEYVKDAVRLLLSFLVRIKEEEDIEAPFLTSEEEDESKIPDVGEKTISWEIDPTISNYQLSRLIALFPCRKELHARPTGTFEVIVLVDGEEGDMERRRCNVDGRYDEGDSIFTSWCTMLSIL